MRVAPILPALKLSGSTDGDAKFDGAVDALLRLGTDFDLSIAPTFEVATSNGLATLFSSDSQDTQATLPWRIGGSTTLFWLGDAIPRTSIPAFRNSDLTAKQAAYDRCLSACKTSTADAPSCKRFADAKKSAHDVAASFTPEDFCDEGRDAWMDHEGKVTRELRGTYPVLMTSLGFLWGKDSFDFMAADAGSTLLTLHEDRHRNAYRGAAALAWITRTELPAATTLTLESSMSVESKNSASGRTVEWCSPAGDVPRDGASDPARVCHKRPLGEPGRTRAATLSVRLGMLDRFQDTFRFALGPRVVRSGESWAIGVDAPLYFNLIAAPAEYTGSYKGVLRVVPSVQWALRGTEFPDSRFFITLELLGQRTLFGTALD